MMPLPIASCVIPILSPHPNPKPQKPSSIFKLSLPTSSHPPNYNSPSSSSSSSSSSNSTKAPISTMDSTALLSTRTLRQLPSAAVYSPFSNFSSTRLPMRGNTAQPWHCNNICCKNVSRLGSRRGPDPGGITPNAKAALQTLLSFSVDSSQPTERHISVIRNEKKRALQKILNGEKVGAEKIMKGVYSKYKGAKPVQIEYDAALALVEILIHLGTKESCQEAVRYLDYLDKLDENLPTDAKQLLYRAILYTMLDNNEAKKYWDAYIASVGKGPPIPW